MCPSVIVMHAHSLGKSKPVWRYIPALLMLGGFSLAFGAVTELPPSVKLAPAQDAKGSKNGATKKIDKTAPQGRKSSEALRVAEAERRANFKTCIDGRYPALCKHRLLTASERPQVDAAEKQANFGTCIDGRYPALCKHSWLTSTQREQVLTAEKRENLRVCMDGRYPALCNHALLNKTDAKQVSSAEKGNVR